MSKIHPFLWYDNQAEQAAELYVSTFKNSQITNRVPGPDGKPMVVEFEIDGQRVSALNGGPEHFRFNESFSFAVSCDDQAEVDDYWAKLTADGGEESQCGWLKDKYGLSWQIVPTALGELLGDPDPQRAGRAAQAMFGMRKLDIQGLRDAADGK